MRGRWAICGKQEMLGGWQKCTNGKLYGNQKMCGTQNVCSRKESAELHNK